MNWELRAYSVVAALVALVVALHFLVPASLWVSDAEVHFSNAATSDAVEADVRRQINMDFQGAWRLAFWRVTDAGEIPSRSSNWQDHLFEKGSQLDRFTLADIGPRTGITGLPPGGLAPGNYRGCFQWHNGLPFPLSRVVTRCDYFSIVPHNE